MNKDMKVGVFLCDCGQTLSQAIDFPGLKSKLKADGHADYVGLFHDLCLKKTQKDMQKAIQDKGITRVVVAACSPELHQQTFMGVLSAAGLNSHMLSMANIREQCSWVHPNHGKATRKAMSLIEMAIGHARLAEPVESADVPVERQVLIVGGGLVGIQAAIELSALNTKVTLLEKDPVLGGRFNRLSLHFPLEHPAAEWLATRIAQLAENKNVTVLTSAELVGLTGQVGSFSATIKKDGKVLTRKCGAVIVATGYETGGTAGPEVSAKVITQSQLQSMLNSQAELKAAPKTVGFIADVSNPHSRVSTQLVLASARAAKEKFGSEVCVFCKNLKVDGAGVEKLYRDCRNGGILFFKFDKPPVVSRQNGHVEVRVEDILMAGEQLALSCDLVVVEEKAKPRADSGKLASLLSIDLGPGGFYQEDNIHLYPTATNRKGIFVAGECHGELDLSRALVDARNAAIGAYQLVSKDKVTVDFQKVWIDPAKCRFCLTCIRACPHSAISEAQVENQTRVAAITDLACQGCGVCVAVCPAKAILYKTWSDEQILAELEPIGGQQ